MCDNYHSGTIITPFTDTQMFLHQVSCNAQHTNAGRYNKKWFVFDVPSTV